MDNFKKMAMMAAMAKMMGGDDDDDDNGVVAVEDSGRGIPFVCKTEDEFFDHYVKIIQLKRGDIVYIASTVGTRKAIFVKFSGVGRCDLLRYDHDDNENSLNWGSFPITCLRFKP